MATDETSKYKIVYQQSIFNSDEIVEITKLRSENEHLRETNRELEEQLQCLRKELEGLYIERKHLNDEIAAENDQHKEIVWNLSGDIQKIQEERLEWKAKYLEVCMKSNDQNYCISVEKSKDNEISNRLTDNLVTPVLTNQLWDPFTKRFECKDCKATFRQFSSVKAHIEKNRCVKYSFQCPQCSVVFSNADSFAKHLKYHIGKTILCEYCGEKFLHEKGLQRHVKIYHTEFNPRYACQLCSKVFLRKSLLENHIRRHFDYRPFKCNSCDKSFKTRQYLTGHINGVHKSDKQFVCDKCDARFSWRTTWKRHMAKHLNKLNKKKLKKHAIGASVGGLLNLPPESLTQDASLPLGAFSELPSQQLAHGFAIPVSESQLTRDLVAFSEMVTPSMDENNKS